MNFFNNTFKYTGQKDEENGDDNSSISSIESLYVFNYYFPIF